MWKHWEKIKTQGRERLKYCGAELAKVEKINNTSDYVQPLIKNGCNNNLLTDVYDYTEFYIYAGVIFLDHNGHKNCCKSRLKFTTTAITY